MHTKRAMAIRWLAVGVVALAGLVVGAALAVDRGDVAPGFKLARLGAAGELNLGDLRGKVVMIDFWASWCAPCQKSMPQFDALAKEFPADRFELVGVNVDSDIDAAKKVLSKRPVAYTIVSDPSGSLPGRYGVETMPMAYLVDADGAIRHVHKGFREGDTDKLREQIQKLLAETR